MEQDSKRGSPIKGIRAIHKSLKKERYMPGLIEKGTNLFLGNSYLNTPALSPKSRMSLERSKFHN